MPLIIPDWMVDLDRDKLDERILINRYLIKSAALLHHPEGGLENLAASLGMSYVALVRSYLRASHATIRPLTALRLEKLLGPDVMPASLTRPDLF